MTKFIMNVRKSDKLDDSESEKVLVSFYLSQKTSEQIDDILFYLKKQLPFDKRRKLTKSFLYEASFKILIEDYNKQGEESLLSKAIQNHWLDYGKD